MHHLEELSPTSKFDWKANPTIVPMYTAHLTHTSNLLKYLSLKVIHELFKILDTEKVLAIVSEEVDEQGRVDFVVVHPVKSVLAVVELV